MEEFASLLVVHASASDHLVSNLPALRDEAETSGSDFVTG